MNQNEEQNQNLNMKSAAVDSTESTVINQTLRPEIKVRRRRWAGSNNADCAGDSNPHLETVSQAVPIPGTGSTLKGVTGVPRSMARTEDEPPVPSFIPPSATKAPPSFFQQLISQTSAGNTWIIPIICAQKRK
jgi:hypothetical protein